jgi:hypothetical protein
MIAALKKRVAKLEGPAGEGVTIRRLSSYTTVRTGACWPRPARAAAGSTGSGCWRPPTAEGRLTM